ncbi:MAG: hypothetical protein FWF57_08395 [Defluviitaleaceae bacterium]|nr:hypothetical protein [Defluviitaleaceae bacterium]
MQFLDFWHLFWIFFYFGSTILLCIFLKNKSKKFQQIFIYSLIFINFVIHFLGPIIIHTQPHIRFMHISMINICAVLVFLSPFLYFQKDNLLKPGWLLMSIIGSLGMVGFPEAAIGHSPLSLNILRMFVQHLILLYVPILIIFLEHEKLKFYHVFSSAIFYVLIIYINIANDAILYTIGIFPNIHFWNGSFQWHPGSLYRAVNWAIPYVFLQTPFGVNQGNFMYWPVFYMIPVIFLLIIPVSFLIILFFKKFNTKSNNGN